MKNTDYKDVFDMSNEALSMANKFSFDPFAQIQNTIGETIRGMKKVSPILKVKPSAVDSQFIQKNYFIDATQKDKNKQILIDEIKFMKRDGYSFVLEEFFNDTNRNGVFGDSGDVLDFKLLIFATDDGNKIREAYDVVHQKTDEIILFLESDSDLLTGQARLYAKIGANVRKKFFDKEGKLINNSLTDKIQSRKNDIETKVLIELLEKGSIEGSVISFESFFTILKNIFGNMLALNFILGTIMDSVAEKIDFLKVPESFWDSDHKDYFFDKDHLIKNLTISAENIKKLENIFIGTGIAIAGPFASAAPLVMSFLTPKLRPLAQQWITSYNHYITSLIEDLFTKIDNDPIANLLYGEAQKQIAFECGIWNGCIDFISSLFKFISLILKAGASAVEDPALTLETVDNIFDFLSSGEVIETFRKTLTEFCKGFLQDLKEEGTDNINWTKVFYTIGFGIAFVATLFIPIGNVIELLSSLGKFGEIFSILMNGFKETLKIAKTAVSTAAKDLTASLVKSGIRMINEILGIFKNENRLFNFLKNLRKKIIDWIKKNKKHLPLRDENGSLRSRLAKLATKIDDAPEVIKQYERALKLLADDYDLEKEIAAIFTKSGEIIKDITDDLTDSVDLRHYLDELDGAIVTHNHPQGSSLSASDIMVLMEGNIKELRAIATNDGTIFSLKNLGEKLSNEEIVKIIDEVDDIINEITKKQPLPEHILRLFEADEYIRQLQKMRKIEYVKY
jgi:hypothetical protein